MELAKDLFVLRIESGFNKQSAFAAHLGISTRHYQRLERSGNISRKILVKIRMFFPKFAPFVAL